MLAVNSSTNHRDVSYSDWYHILFTLHVGYLNSNQEIGGADGGVTGEKAAKSVTEL